MSDTISCPSCGAPIDWREELAGQAIQCGQCGHSFVVPAPPPVVPPPFSFAPDVEPVPQSAGAPPLPFEIDEPDSETISRARKLETIHRITLWDLIDFRFEHYLTPWIIRAYWVTALALAVIYVLAATADNIVDAMGDTAAFHGELPIEMIGRELPQVIPIRSGVRVTPSPFLTFLRHWSFVVTVPIAVTLVRVGCEMVIVMFNIAGSVKAIEREQLRQQRD